MIIIEDAITQMTSAMNDIDGTTGHIKDPKIQFWIKEGLKLMEKAGEALQNAVNLSEEEEE